MQRKKQNVRGVPEYIYMGTDNTNIRLLRFFHPKVIKQKKNRNKRLRYLAPQRTKERTLTVFYNTILCYSG